MNNTKELVDRHAAIWNEPDADRRRKAFRELWSENAVQYPATAQEVLRRHDER
jgi:hypothetical protein